MPSAIITSANTSACSSSRASSKAHNSHEYREYGASKPPQLPTPNPTSEQPTNTHPAKHASTSIRKGNVVIHNHNMGIEDLSAPSPSSSGAARPRR